MSQYWAGYHGTVCLLTEEEFQEFIHVYNTIAKEPVQLDEESIIREIAFDRSHTYDGNDTFSVCDIQENDCDGMFFEPFMVNGHPNFYHKYRGDYTIRTWRNGTRYVIFSDKSMDSVDTLFSGRPAYGSYEELKQEFQNKLSKYLPNDFDWDAHIGRFSYAAFA